MKMTTVPILGLLFVLGGIASNAFGDCGQSAGISLPCLTEVTQQLPEEASAMLVSPDFAKQMSALNKSAKQRGHVLRLMGFTVYPIGAETYASFEISFRPINSHGQWSPFGHLTSRIVYDQHSQITLEGLWYTPIATPPGGATVGN
jgi:hypothetical protein